MPTNGTLFGSLREISPFERMRGGPGRTTSFPQNQPLNSKCDNQKPAHCLGNPKGVSHFLAPSAIPAIAEAVIANSDASPPGRRAF